jgi:hypothetical protein
MKAQVCRAMTTINAVKKQAEPGNTMPHARHFGSGILRLMHYAASINGVVDSNQSAIS